MSGQNLKEVLAGHPKDPGALVQLLQDVQKHDHYLSKESMRRVANHVGVPLAKVYSVATFYKAFSLVPRGDHLVRVCMGTACHVRGAGLVLEELQGELEIAPGETKEAVAIFGSVAEATDKLLVQILGLWDRISPEGQKVFIEDRMLVLTYYRPGDEYFPQYDKITLKRSDWKVVSREEKQ